MTKRNKIRSVGDKPSSVVQTKKIVEAVGDKPSSVVQTKKIVEAVGDKPSSVVQTKKIVEAVGDKPSSVVQSKKIVEDVGNTYKLLNDLHDNIKKGSQGNADAIKILDELFSRDNGGALLNYRQTNKEQYTGGTHGERGTEDTLLHTAALYQEDTDLLQKLVTGCPGLVTVARTGDWLGQTALHITLSKGNDRASELIIEYAGADKQEQLFASRATGSKFNDTVLMGQFPLSVAALTFNEQMVSFLLDKGDRISRQNSNGDTLIHTLIKFAGVRREKTSKVVNMLHFLHDKLRDCQTSRPREDPRAIWYKANRDKMSALKLAAHLGQLETFSAILRLDRVYRVLESHDGVMDTHRYDVTEIDPMTQQKSEFEKLKAELKGGYPQVCSLKARFQSRRPLSVLEIICSRSVKQAHGLVNVDVVKDIIRKKWIWYRKIHYTWALFHLSFTVLLSTYAVFKTKVINSDIAGVNTTTNGLNTTMTNGLGNTTHQQHRAFTDISIYVHVVYAAFIILFELRRSLYLRQWWYWRLPHHNAWYRTTLIIFSISLILDCILYKTGVDNQIPLLLALLIGWWFLTFFLRSVKKFSFYTVMFQKVLSGDLPRSCSIILLELFSFSLAMYITIRTEPERKEFQDIWSTLLTMFNLMLGLGDIDLLYEARELWLAVILYVMFILITYLLLINSLIAMMSKTCNSVSDHRDAQWDLQRLSLILFLESTLFFHKLQVGPLNQLKYVSKTEMIGREVNERRHYHRFSSHQTNQSSGRERWQRPDMISTFGFPEQKTYENMRSTLHSSSHELNDNERRTLHPSSSDSYDKKISSTATRTCRFTQPNLDSPTENDESTKQQPSNHFVQLIPVGFIPHSNSILGTQTTWHSLPQSNQLYYRGTKETLQPSNQPPIVSITDTSLLQAQPFYCILVQPGVNVEPMPMVASQTQPSLPRPVNVVNLSSQRRGSGHQKSTSGDTVETGGEKDQKHVWLDVNDLDSEGESFRRFNEGSFP